MRRLRYRVACLTHGQDSETLSETLASFVEFVTPQPLDWIIVQDGPGYWTIPDGFAGYAGQAWSGQVGFCEATRRLWEMASKSRELNYGARGQGFFIPDPPPFIFWLEHDFRFTRPVDLHPIAELLDEARDIAQVALMRDAVNETEIAAGGLFESWPFAHDHLVREGHDVLLHRGYFTTNPSLMRTEFMREEPWPAYPEECEGRFGLDLVDAGYRFAAWGDGEPWVEHIGTRTGRGY